MSRGLVGVVISGGGPVGSVLALALAQGGIKCHVIEKTPWDSFISDTSDIRGIALARSSMYLLKNLGVFDVLMPHAAPIRAIQVMSGDRPRDLSFTDRGEPMGVIVEGFHLRHALAKAAAAHPLIEFHAGQTLQAVEPQEVFSSVVLSDGTELKTSLIVAAEGRQSPLRDKFHIPVQTIPYNQEALVLNIHHENPHEGRAYEKFYPGGPFATLPLPGNSSAIVWSDRPQSIKLLETMPESQFLALLQERVPPSYGNIRLASAKKSYPLGLMRAKRLDGPHFALVGDAAHVMHPLAGQGMNVGLRDAGVLADLLRKAHSLGLDLGNAQLLSEYTQKRRGDILGLLAVTHGLSRIFSHDFGIVSSFLGKGLSLVQKLPIIKHLAAQHAMGLLGKRVPLLREVPLDIF